MLIHTLESCDIQSQTMFLRLILVLIPSLVVAAQMGGWSKADPKAPEVVEAAQFAVKTKYAGEQDQFRIEQAKKQV